MGRLLAWAALAAVIFTATGFAAAAVVEAVRAQLRGRPSVARRLSFLVTIWCALFVITMAALTGALHQLLAVVALALVAFASRPAQRALARRRQPPPLVRRSHYLADDLTVPLLQVVEAAEAEALAWTQNAAYLASRPAPPPFQPDPALIADRRLRRDVQAMLAGAPRYHLALRSGGIACHALHYPGRRSTSDRPSVTCPDCRLIIAADHDG